VHAAPELYQVHVVKKDDMPAKTTMAKLVTFLFFQDILSVQTQNLRNVRVLSLGEC
jgi:hypothetical protein